MARKRRYELGRQLTPRDQEVLALLRRGLTDAEIAKSLGISRRGASYHVSQIIAKLGVRSRYEAAAWPDRPPWLPAVALIVTWRQLGRAGKVATQLSVPAAAAVLVSACLGLGLMAFLIVRTSHESSIHANGATAAFTAQIAASGDSVSVATFPLETQAPATHAKPTYETPPFTRPAYSSNGQLVTDEPLETAPITAELTPTPTVLSGQVISAGNGHACVITSVASLKCWGENQRGQLGDGTTNDSSTPVTVDLGLSVIDVVAANFYTCAVTIDGAVFCWGDNLSAVLGSGIAQSSIPVKVIGSGSGVRAISGGVQHVCALTSAGKLLCWGWAGWGQIAPNAHGFQMTPLEVPGVDGVTSVVAGGYHTCVVLESGHAKCWGEMFGWEPVELLGNDGQQLADVVQITEGVCVLFKEGTVQCKDGDRFQSVVDSAGSSLTGMVAAWGGTYYGCALTALGAVKCWDNRSGDAQETLTAVDMPGLERGVASLGTYGGRCVLMQDGTAKCWGDNRYGQLGDGGKCGTECDTPVDVVGIR